MVDFHDPIVIAQELWVIEKVFHVLAGLYMWEFLTTLDYEWSVIRGRRLCPWTIWIYSFARVATLMSVILDLVGLDTARPIDCQVRITFNFVFGYLAVAASLLLIVLRTIAIWNKNKIVIVLSTSIWGTFVAFLIEGVSRIRSEWQPANETCTPPNMESNKLTIIAMFTTDTVLALIMLIGLLRLRGHGGGMFNLGRLLWKQGVIWLLIATAAGLTTMVFVCLDLNQPLDMMFLMPALITISITASRMYTSLADFSSSADIARRLDSQRGPIHHTASNVEEIPVVHMAREQYPTSQTAVLTISVNGQERDKPRRLSLDDNLERGLGK